MTNILDEDDLGLLLAVVLYVLNDKQRNQVWTGTDDELRRLSAKLTAARHPELGGNTTRRNDGE